MFDWIQSLDIIIESIPSNNSGRATSEIAIHRYDHDQVLPLSFQGAFTYLVIKGAVKVTGSNWDIVYSPGQYFVSASVKNSPAHIRAIASSCSHVGLRIEMPTEDVVAVMLEMEVNFTTAVLKQSAFAHPENHDHAELLELVHRMLKLEADGKNTEFMRRHLRRELAYCLMTGPQGNAFLQDVLQTHNAKDIYTVNDWIKTNYRSVFVVDELADQARMSVSTFHKKFKGTIGMAPLQCQKQLRLAEARRLMLNEGMCVTDAALEVGYESLSQFSREYRKMFGNSAQEDIRHLRSRLTEQQ